MADLWWTAQAQLLAADPILDDRPRSEVALRALHYQATASRDVRRAFASAADVRANGDDAVRVELEHREGVATIVLGPNRRNRLARKIAFGQIAASIWRAPVWPAQ